MKLVITNLRIPSDEWVQVKTLASELGVSANTIIRDSIKDYTLRKMVGIQRKEKKAQPTIWEEWMILATTPSKSVAPLSEEDTTIYE